MVTETYPSSPLERFARLRKRFPQMHYESVEFEESQNELKVQFSFRIPPLPPFRTLWRLPKPPGGSSVHHLPWVRNFAFHLGLVEMISYWKGACPPWIHVIAGELSIAQALWWRKLFHRGLSEFSYRNGLAVGEEEWVQFVCEKPRDLALLPWEGSRRSAGILVPVGGGKDSLVTLHLLQSRQEPIYLFFLNPGKRQWKIAEYFGFPKERVFVAHRTLDPLLVELNAKGWLNGHIPFSAVLAFASVWVAALFGLSHVIVSHEASADCSTVPGTEVNHQYSKSSTFEQDFRQYLAQWLSPHITYFSLLRPWNELQITHQFSHLPSKVGEIFRSCNARTPDETWCGQCPKCLFVHIMLSAFLPQPTCRAFLGCDPLNDVSLAKVIDSLTLSDLASPFECVGTKEETRAALSACIHRSANPAHLPLLVRRFAEHHRETLFCPEKIAVLLSSWHPVHWLPKDFEANLKLRTPSFEEALEELRLPLNA